MKPRIGITIGDFNGVGPEVALKAVRQPAVKKICFPFLIGPYQIFEEVANSYRIPVKLERTTLHAIPKGAIPVLDVGDGIPADIQYGTPTKASGKSAGVAIERAVEETLHGKLDAIVTAPASKEALHMAGYNFPGQTEMIALLSGSKRVLMVLGNSAMKVGLVTIHTPIRDVSQQITKEKIVDKILILSQSLRIDFKISTPSIGVLALNPHAGEHGILGMEEETIILPALEEARRQGFNVEGPFSPDAFFGLHAYKKYDAILAMYHDQGLIPMKMLDFERGVNFSAGLSIVRTSPDHGTAYDIAGKNKASVASMIEAIRWAATIALNRKKQ